MSYDFKPVSGGWAYEDQTAFIFFGDRDSQLPHLQQLYPQFSFRRIKQVHGDHIVENSAQFEDFSLQADGHFSTEKGLALCSISADCMPLLLVHRQKPWVMALHAGWRGVAQRLLPKALDLVQTHDLQIKDLDLYIGPHILFPSFEVKEDAFALLRSSSTSLPYEFSKDHGDGTYHVDLIALVKSQIRGYGLPDSQIHILSRDTATDSRLHSFRRDAKDAGRQISFVVLKLSP